MEAARRASACPPTGQKKRADPGETAPIVGCRVFQRAREGYPRWRWVCTRLDESIGEGAGHETPRPFPALPVAPRPRQGRQSDEVDASPAWAGTLPFGWVCRAGSPASASKAMVVVPPGGKVGLRLRGAQRRIDFRDPGLSGQSTHLTDGVGPVQHCRGRGQSIAWPEIAGIWRVKAGRLGWRHLSAAARCVAARRAAPLGVDGVRPRPRPA